MKKILFTALLGTVVMTGPAMAQKPEYYREDIRAFCENNAAAVPPKPGMQFNGERADSRVMQFKEGEYSFGKVRRNMGLTIYPDGTFFLLLDSKGSTTFGTDGDDYIEGRVVGGCNREQLSEALQKNGMLDLALEAVPLDESLRQTIDE
jgi:hypothetical protein